MSQSADQNAGILATATTEEVKRVAKVMSLRTIHYYNPVASEWKVAVEGIGLKFPYSVSFLVTPEWAKDVMANRNPNNRRITPPRISKYGRVMAAGKWKVNNDDICFDWDGNLLNGQHRLSAVIWAKTSVVMSFKFGMDPSCLSTIDEGKARSNLDIARLTGRSRATSKAMSAVRFMFEMRKKGDTASREEILDAYDRLLDGLQFTTTIISRSPYARSPVHAAIVRAYYFYLGDSNKIERLSQFCQILNDGTWSGNVKDTAATHMRQFIDRNCDAHAGPNRREFYHKMENAISRFMDELPTSKLYEARDEIYPLPEELKK